MNLEKGLRERQVSRHGYRVTMSAQGAPNQKGIVGGDEVLLFSFRISFPAAA